MTDKTTAPEKALARIKDNSSVMIGGFGAPGTPFTLIRELLKQNPARLRLIKNDANEEGMGISLLFEAGCADKFVVSHMGLNNRVIKMMNQGKIYVQMFPQGIMAEKIRAGGAGIPAFLTDIGLDTVLRKERQTVTHQGREYILEPALRADFALIHAEEADAFGNLRFTKTARNFSPLMAMAADTVIVEAFDIHPAGALDPDCIHLPGAFVDHVVCVDRRGADYQVLSHHAL
ncbi:MAG: CoA transferase subunit A [Desulfonatronovibrionaceae bacterium]